MMFATFNVLPTLRQKGIGSFQDVNGFVAIEYSVCQTLQDCWLIVFLAVVVAVIVSLAYITVLGSLKAGTDAG